MKTPYTVIFRATENDKMIKEVLVFAESKGEAISRAYSKLAFRYGCTQEEINKIYVEKVMIY